MFTGIITHAGIVRRIDFIDGGARLQVESGLPERDLALGASVAHDGCCLTIVSAEPAGQGRMLHMLDVSRETLARTTLGEWAVGRVVNLEAAARFGDAIGGHHVLGHVDDGGAVLSVRNDGDSTRIEIAAPRALAPFIAEKGSIAVDGVSLTVNGVRDTDDGAVFALTIIPHTLQVTTLGQYAPGRRVNLEIDPLARYVARLAQAQAG